MSLPVTACDSIEKTCRSFIWGSSQEDRKISLLPWSKIIQDKVCGGLGIRCMREMNDAFGLKLC